MEIFKEKTSTGHSLRVDSQDLQNFFNLTGQLLTLKNLLIESPEISRIAEPKLKQGLVELSRLTRKIEDCALSLKLSPIKALMLKTHRMVFEVAKKANKSVELRYKGEDTRVDREMLDYLSDILTHLVRNSIDHGIESPQERSALGKPEMAEINITTSTKGREILIEFSDDGRGIDRRKVLQKALEKKLLEPGENLELIPDEKVFSFLFHGGLSTAENVTDISGRGVGLGFVKTTIEKLRGKIKVKSIPGQGTTFIISLPIDTSILDVLVAEINKIQYLISLTDIEMVFLQEEFKIYQVPNSKRFIIKGGLPIPLIEPGKFFPNGEERTRGKETILIFSQQNNQYGLLVDDLIYQTQIVYNSLPPNLAGKQNFISGSAPMATGQVSLLIDLNSLVDHHLALI
jgi:two-component system, chemotaxis family, sensor kinase CheA